MAAVRKAWTCAGPAPDSAPTRNPACKSGLSPYVCTGLPRGAIMGATMRSHPSSSPSAAPIAETSAQVSAYCQIFPFEHERVAPLLAALASGDDIHSRSTSTCHLAASGIVVQSGRLLTIYHPYLRRWIQPGGHLEAEEAPEQAALCETAEETGVSARLHPWHAAHRCPVDIDVHLIPANPRRREGAHLHFDFRYLLICTSAPTGTAELETRWLDRAQIKEQGIRNAYGQTRRTQPSGSIYLKNQNIEKNTLHA